MKKIRDNFGFILGAVFLALLAYSVAYSASAQGQGAANANKSVKAQGTEETKGGKTVPGNVELDTTMEVNEIPVPVQAKKVPAKTNAGQVNAEAHRSTVANFVQGLLSVADREGGIGEQVRVIAKEQEQSKEREARSIEAVQTRSKWKVFFFGSDWENLGQLRSDMTRTRSRIDQLIRLSDRTENEEDKTELQNQIMALQVEQAEIQDFITANETEIGVIGWVTRLFK